MKSEAWREQAGCRKVEVTVFFPVEHLRSGAYAEARRICAKCPVVEECLEDALASKRLEGFRGGKTPEELRALARSRPRPVRRCIICSEEFTQRTGMWGQTHCHSCATGAKWARGKGTAFGRCASCKKPSILIRGRGLCANCVTIPDLSKRRSVSGGAH